MTKLPLYRAGARTGTALAGTALAIALSISGCALLAVPADPQGGSANPTATPRATAGASTPGSTEPIPADGGIVTLTPEQVTPLEVFTRSSPNGTFPVGSGLPDGYPAGVPAFTNRWVEDNFLTFTTGEGLEAFGVMFAGSYADIDDLLVEFDAQGYRVGEDSSNATRRLVTLENETYRVTITATESAESGDTVLDPSFSYTIVLK